jgi:sulfur carrier protein ThiS
MRVTINLKVFEFPKGTVVEKVTDMIRNWKKDEPMISAIKEKTGRDNIVFVLNGMVIQPDKYSTLELKENDDIRWIHPCFGG